MSLEQLPRRCPRAKDVISDPASPMPMRKDGSKGMAPLPPREMVIALCGFTFESDEKLAQAAGKSLAGLPDKIIVPAIDAKLPEAALFVLAPLLTDRDDVLEKLVTVRHTPDAVIASIAATVSAKIGEIIASDQERCLRSMEVVNAVRNNDNILRSSLDRLFDFLVRSGVIYDDMPEFGEAIGRLSPTEMQEAAEKIELPPGLDAFLEDDERVDQRAEEAAAVIELHDHEEAKRRIPVLKLIAGMSIAQKISLSLKGNKEARTILVRDSNKVVCSAAIRNPRITESELLAAAQSRQVSDEVIRIISRSKEMSRSYAVKHALVKNPKTPIQTSMRFLTLLRDSDVKGIAKSRNVPSAISNQAKRHLAKKRH
ncbi:MAG: hypothetical protein R3C68_11295 [Myxococcota bacterium]